MNELLFFSKSNNFQHDFLQRIMGKEHNPCLEAQQRINQTTVTLFGYATDHFLFELTKEKTWESQPVYKVTNV